VTGVTQECLNEEFFNRAWSRYASSAMACNHLMKKLLVFLTLGLIVMGSPRRTVAQVRKSCPDGVTLKASAGMAAQGSLILTEVVAPKTAAKFTSEWDGNEMPLWQENPASGALHGLLGIDLEKVPGTYEWKVSWPGAEGDAESCSVTITVRAGKFPTERLKVNPQFVQPNPEQEKQAEEDSKKMRAIYDTVTPERLWQGKFRLPLKNVTTGGNFGRRRVLNGEARSPHAGVDFPAAAGTAVFASQSGKVVLAEGLYYSGNTVVIDHGYGIYTMYAHLSKIEVQAGEMVKAGEELGKVGATGRVTGPHLHWGLTINHARVNAMQIAQRQP
jgi:Peptidase family M23